MLRAELKKARGEITALRSQAEARRVGPAAAQAPPDPDTLSQAVQRALQEHLLEDVASRSQRGRGQVSDQHPAEAHAASDDDDEEDMTTGHAKAVERPRKRQKADKQPAPTTAAGVTEPPEAMGRPATITPECQRAFMEWLDAKRTIKEARALDIWMEKASERWSLETWTEKLKAKGMKHIPQTRELLMEAALRLFVQKNPEFHPPGVGRRRAARWIVMKIAGLLDLVTWTMRKLWRPLLKLACVAWLWRCSLDVAASAATEAAVGALMTALPDSVPENGGPHGPLFRSDAVFASWWTPAATLTDAARANATAIADMVGEIGARRLHGEQAQLLWDRFTTMAMTSLVDVAVARVRR